MVINTDESFESAFAVISNRSLLLDEIETLAFEQPNEFIEFHRVA